MAENQVNGCPQCHLTGYFQAVGMEKLGVGTDPVTHAPSKAVLATQILCANCGYLISVTTDLTIPPPVPNKTIVKPETKGGKN